MRATLAGRAVWDEPPSSARTCGHTTIGPMIDVIMADAAAKEAKKVARVR
jgi:hypothetical protein